MSCAGMPSVMAQISRRPAVAPSMIASAQKGGATKVMEASAPVAATASRTVSNTGRPRWVRPPLPGVTPPTTLPPYSCISLPWKEPLSPVKPWIRIFVFLSMRMLMLRSLFVIWSPGGGSCGGAKQRRKNLLFLKKKKQKDFYSGARGTIPAMSRIGEAAEK